MIELLTGENDFELKRALARRRRSFDGNVEKIDGSELNLNQLPDIFSGATLFSSTRCIIITDVSSNSVVWPLIPDWAEKANADTTVLLVEPKPDKRTSTYKWLKKHAVVHEFAAWTQRDSGRAEEWLRAEAESLGFTLSHAAARTVVQRVGTDQWELWHALQKLALVETPNDETVSGLFEPRAEESVFELFETALKRDTGGVVRMISTLRLSEDPYRVFGLLSGQAFQLAALVYGAGDRDVAADFGVSPYALGKLRPFAARMQPRHLVSVVDAFAKSDERLKTSQVDPWLVVEQTLLSVAAEN